MKYRKKPLVIEAQQYIKEIVARIWCDQNMGHIVMDVELAQRIADLVYVAYGGEDEGEGEDG